MVQQDIKKFSNSSTVTKWPRVLGTTGNDKILQESWKLFAGGEPGQDLWFTWRSMPPGVGMSEQIMHAARRGRRGGNVQDGEEAGMAGSDAFTLETRQECRESV